MNPKTENPDTMAEQPLRQLKRDALAMVGQCSECGVCYLRCAFKNYGDDPDRCKRWVRESNALLLGRRRGISPELIEATFKCAECNRCFHLCPMGVYRRHGNMMMKHLIGNPLRHRINIHPYSNWRIKQPWIEKSTVSRWGAEEKDWYHHRLNTFEPAEVLLFHGCYLYSQAAQCLKLEKMLTAAGVSFTAVGKLNYCCGSFAFYRGHNAMKSIRPRLLEMIERVRPQRIITNCGHCFNAMSDLMRNWQDGQTPVRHACEELLELAEAERLAFSNLGETYAIHDACNFRSLHDDDGALRKLLRRFGDIRELPSNGRKGKCCGDVSGYYASRGDHLEEKVREFVGCGAGRLVTVCAGCFEQFHDNPQLRTIDLIDIAHQAFAAAAAGAKTGRPMDGRAKCSGSGNVPKGDV